MSVDADISAAIVELDDEGVEQFLFDCLERRFGREKLQASDYTFNLTLPVGYRVLTPTVWIEAEVSNGGAGQYFWNRLVDYRPMTRDAIEGYEKIGAIIQAGAVRECVKTFVPLEPRCRRIKERRLGVKGFRKWMEIWDSLSFLGDNPLFDYELVTKQFRVPWIRQNIKEFAFRD